MGKVSSSLLLRVSAFQRPAFNLLFAAFILLLTPTVLSAQKKAVQQPLTRI